MNKFADWGESARRVADTPIGRYALAAALVLTIAAFRGAFDPGLGSGAYFMLYFPAFALIAYLFGVGPVALAITLAVALSYYVFIEPELRADPKTMVRLALYVVSSAMVAFVVMRVRERLGALTRDLADVSALTRGQAELFREHAERVSNHLQLISALLQLNARDEAAEDSARVLRNAASRTLLISRMHRAFANPGEAPINFAAFAERLADSALESHNRPPLSIIIEGDLELLPEQATSLALVLLECISARARQRPRGVMNVALSQRGREAALTITEDVSGEEMRERDMYLLGALAEQMQGRLVLAANERRGTLRLAFPTEAQPLPKWEPLAPLN